MEETPVKRAEVTAAFSMLGGAVRPSDDSSPVPVDELTPIGEMPDPLVMNDSTPVRTKEQWAIRRLEMIRILEDYTYGHMPPAPGNVTGAPIGTPATLDVGDVGEVQYQKIHLTFGPDEELGFDLALFLPSEAGPPAGGLPVLVSLGFS